jgi:hypothetical protein
VIVSHTFFEPHDFEVPVSDLPVVAQILASAVGLVGALVAGMSVSVAYRGRHNQFRQIVYTRQMDACFDIAEAMSDLFTAAQAVLAISHSRAPGEDARGRFRSAVRGEHDRFIGAVNRSLIVLPSRVKAAVDAFHDALLGLAEGQSPDPGADLAPAYQRAINSIRHHLAIDSLTTGLLNEMGIGTESVALRHSRTGESLLLPVGRSAT